MHHALKAAARTIGACSLEGRQFAGANADDAGRGVPGPRVQHQDLALAGLEEVLQFGVAILIDHSRVGAAIYVVKPLGVMSKQLPDPVRVHGRSKR